MTQETIAELVKQVPALVVLVFVVIRFLRHIGERDRQFEAVIARVSGQCHEVQQAASRAIESNTVAVAEIRPVLAEVRDALTRM